MLPRPLDLVVFGATGFTGAEVAVALAQGAIPGITWGIAGRSRDKLKALAARCEAEGLVRPPILVADLDDIDAMLALARSARLVINCTGPYRFFGDTVVKACVASETHYMDLCGEPEFYDRCLLDWHASAVAARTLVVHAAAWDSVPADVGTLLAARQCLVVTGRPAQRVDVLHRFAGAGLHGHATTFEAAVHGFGAAADGTLKALRANVQRRFPDPPSLQVHRKQVKAARVRTTKLGWFGWDPSFSAYRVRFPGSDAAVVRFSQRRLAAGDVEPGSNGNGSSNSDSSSDSSGSGAGAAYLPEALCPPVAVCVLVPTLKGLLLVTAYGLLFALLAKWAWGRRLLLAHPSFFSGGVFTHEGPSRAQLAQGGFTTTVVAYPMPATRATARDTAAAAPVAVALSGPEPGYVATPKLVLALAATALFAAPEDAHAAGSAHARVPAPNTSTSSALPSLEGYALAASSGCCTPAALVGPGRALDALVRRLEAAGICVAGI